MDMLLKKENSWKFGDPTKGSAFWELFMSGNKLPGCILLLIFLFLLTLGALDAQLGYCLF